MDWRRLLAEQWWTWRLRQCLHHNLIFLGLGPGPYDVASLPTLRPFLQVLVLHGGTGLLHQCLLELMVLELGALTLIIISRVPQKRRLRESFGCPVLIASWMVRGAVVVLVYLFTRGLGGKARRLREGVGAYADHLCLSLLLLILHLI